MPPCRVLKPCTSHDADAKLGACEEYRGCWQRREAGELGLIQVCGGDRHNSILAEGQRIIAAATIKCSDAAVLHHRPQSIRRRPQTSAPRCCEGLPTPLAQESITSSCARRNLARVNSNIWRAKQYAPCATTRRHQAADQRPRRCRAGLRRRRRTSAVRRACCVRDSRAMDEMLRSRAGHRRFCSLVSRCARGQSARRRFRGARADLREGADRCERNWPGCAARGMLAARASEGDVYGTPISPCWRWAESISRMLALVLQPAQPDWPESGCSRAAISWKRCGGCESCKIF